MYWNTVSKSFPPSYPTKLCPHRNTEHVRDKLQKITRAQPAALLGQAVCGFCAPRSQLCARESATSSAQVRAVFVYAFCRQPSQSASERACALCKAFSHGRNYTLDPCALVRMRIVSIIVRNPITPHAHKHIYTYIYTQSRTKHHVQLNHHSHSLSLSFLLCTLVGSKFSFVNAPVYATCFFKREGVGVRQPHVCGEHISGTTYSPSCRMDAITFVVPE